LALTDRLVWSNSGIHRQNSLGMPYSRRLPPMTIPRTCEMHDFSGYTQVRKSLRRRKNKKHKRQEERGRMETEMRSRRGRRAREGEWGVRGARRRRMRREESGILAGCMTRTSDCLWRTNVGVEWRVCGRRALATAGPPQLNGLGKRGRKRKKKKRMEGRWHPVECQYDEEEGPTSATGGWENDTGGGEITRMAFPLPTGITKILAPGTTA